MSGKRATNDEAESSFAGLTRQIQCYGHIGMHNASGISDAKRNGFLYRPLTEKEIASGKQGLIHTLPMEELKMTLVLTAMEDAPAARAANMAEVEAHRERRREKEEIAKHTDWQGVDDQHIEALIYHKMGESEVCWRTATEVNQGFRRLTTKKDKYSVLKDNIRIRVIGYGWVMWDTRWTEGGRTKSVEELARRLKEIIAKTRKWKIPDRPEPPT